MSLSGCTPVIVSGDRGGKTVRWEKWQQFSCFMWLIWGARGPVWVMCVYPHSIYILTGYLADAAVSWQGELHVRTCPARWGVLLFNLSGLRINVLFKAVCSKEVIMNQSNAGLCSLYSNQLMLYLLLLRLNHFLRFLHIIMITKSRLVFLLSGSCLRSTTSVQTACGQPFNFEFTFIYLLHLPVAPPLGSDL